MPKTKSRKTKKAKLDIYTRDQFLDMIGNPLWKFMGLNGSVVSQTIGLVVPRQEIDNFNEVLNSEGCPSIPVNALTQLFNAGGGDVDHKLLSNRVKKFYELMTGKSSRGKSRSNTRQKVVSVILSQVKKMSPKKDNVYFELTRDFGWTAGEFGNSNSCWFGSGTQGRSRYKWHIGGIATTSNKDQTGCGYGIKFYATNEQYRGQSKNNNKVYHELDDGTKLYSRGRAWIIPHNSGFVIINNYDRIGGEKNLDLNKMARLLSSYLSDNGAGEIFSHRVSVEFPNHDVYANGNTGVYIYPASKKVTCEKRKVVHINVNNFSINSPASLVGTPYFDEIGVMTRNFVYAPLSKVVWMNNSTPVCDFMYDIETGDRLLSDGNTVSATVPSNIAQRIEDTGATPLRQSIEAILGRLDIPNNDGLSKALTTALKNVYRGTSWEMVMYYIDQYCPGNFDRERMSDVIREIIRLYR